MTSKNNTPNNLQEINDNELVLKVFEDPNNFKYIIQKYEHKLSQYIQRILYVNKEDIEDILQEVFINVYKNLNAYNPNYKFSSWIYRITHNECINFLRRNKNLKQINTNIRINNENDEIFDLLDNIASDIDLEKEIIKNHEKDIVHKILLELDEKYRAVLVLKYLEEKDYTEISDILKIPIGTVGSLINRAKKNFIKILKEKYDK